MRRGLSSLIVPTLVATVAACTTDRDHDDPPPTDPIVYAASAATRADTGIAKWGYETDAKGTTIFHGYDAHNATIVEVRHIFELTGQFTRRFAMKLNGPEVSAAVHVEFESVWDASAQRAHYVAHVVENTVEPGGLASRILDHVAPDARTIPASAGADLPEVDTNVAPRTVGSGLVDENGKPVTCCCQLRNDGAAWAGSTLSECSQLGMSDQATPQAIGLKPQGGPGGGPGGYKQDLIVVNDNNGDPTVQVNSGWNGDYNLVDHHCHNAAAGEVSANTGYIACGEQSSTTSWGGHTVNWAPDPTKQGQLGAYCAYEPQENGLTLINGAACCWQGGFTLGAPDVSNNPDGQACVKKMCGEQYTPPGTNADGTPNPGTTLMPPGQVPQTAMNCPAESTSLDECNTCCTNLGNDVASKFPNYRPDDITGFRHQCSKDCNDQHGTGGPSLVQNQGPAPQNFAGTVRPLDLGGPPKSALAGRCYQSGLQASDALRAAVESCAKTGHL